MTVNDLAGWMTQIIDLHSNLPVQTVYYGARPKDYAFSGENEPTGVVVRGPGIGEVPVPTVTVGGIVTASSTQLDMVALGDGLGPVHWVDLAPRSHFFSLDGAQPPLAVGETRLVHRGDYRVIRFIGGGDPTGVFVKVDGKQFGVPSASHGAAIDIGGTDLSLYAKDGSGTIFWQDITT